MSKFYLRLRELRKSRELTQKELANYLQISKSSVNMYERGEREPSLDTLEAIADFFNVDMDYLTGKTSEIKLFTSISNTNAKELIFGTEHEREIINAYRESSKDTKIAVCKILDVEMPQKTTIFRAARSEDNHPPEIIETTKDFSKVPTTKNKDL